MTVNVEIYSKNMTVTDRIDEYIRKRASRLDRYLNGIDEVRVDLDHVKTARNISDREVAQITVRGTRFILRSEEKADDVFVAFDRALDKVQRQIARYKGKRNRGRGDGKSAGDFAMEEEALEALPFEPVVEEAPVISRRKRFILVPMDEEEAIEQMTLLGHDNFFVFYNVNTSSVNVLYRRSDGTYALIETQAG